MGPKAIDSPGALRYKIYIMKARVVLFLLFAAPALARGGGDALSSLGDISLAPVPEVSVPYVRLPRAHDYGLVDAAPVDENAGSAARGLYSRLLSQYAKRVISGHTAQYFQQLVSLAGKRPVIQGFDMQNYSPHNPWHDDWSAWDDGTVQAAIDWHRSTGGSGIVAFQWHWFSPAGGSLKTSTFYTKNTPFDAARAVTAGTEEYRLVLRDIDAIAVQLKRLQAAGVPVLWRPMHEAGGGWFWWGAKGPENAKKLYYLIYDRLVYHHGLHNLIWVWATPEKEWYPGNGKVDISGYDSYPGPNVHAPQSGMFSQLYGQTGGRKMLALTETGPIPDLGLCFQQDSPWLYFMTWSDTVASQNSGSFIYNAYKDKRVLTLD